VEEVVLACGQSAAEVIEQLAVSPEVLQDLEGWEQGFRFQPSLEASGEENDFQL